MKENNIKKVLLLGSGALKIGEAGEFTSCPSPRISWKKSLRKRSLTASCLHSADRLH